MKDTPYEIVILPWGATEAHNYHLPYSADVLQCDYVAAESARRAWERGVKSIVLPTVPFGVNTGQLDVKLDINMNPGTQAAVLRDIIYCLNRQEFTKLVIINGHGGNDFKQMIRELQPQFPNIFICTLNWWQVVDWNKYFDEPGDHAGEAETGPLQVIAPDLVLPLFEAGSGATKKFKLKALRERWVWAPREWTQSTIDTGIGNPSKATPEKGKIFLDAVTEKIAEFLIELASANINEMYE